MQNTEIEKAISWNPWHGCKKASPGCKNCFVFKMDKRYLNEQIKRAEEIQHELESIYR